jgi:uncharacterized RDD family membrane protein YckC
MDVVFERVLATTELDDGPRAGIANFDGRPHFFECEWNESADRYASTFRLSPVTPEVLALALEDAEICERWWMAFQEGRTTLETRPALPEDHPRHVELENLLRDRLRIDPADCTRVLAEFRTAANWDNKGLAPLEVRWERCPALSQSGPRFATFWQRFAASLLDMLVLLPVGVAQLWWESTSKEVALALCVPSVALSLGYTIYCHGRFGQTFGKWMMWIRVVRVNGERMGWRQAWLRSSVELFFSALHVAGRIVALASTANSEYFGVGWSQRGLNVAGHEPAWAVWAGRVAVLWFWSEVVTMLFNKRRRALHDFIAGTIVIVEERSPKPTQPQ